MKHTWDEELIKTEGDCRCYKCGMKFSTACDSTMALQEWPEKDKKSDEWKAQWKHYTECEGRK